MFMHGKTMIIPFPNSKILDWSKFKAFADYKINMTEKFKFVLGRVENISMGKCITILSAYTRFRHLG